LNHQDTKTPSYQKVVYPRFLTQSRKDAKTQRSLHRSGKPQITQIDADLSSDKDRDGLRHRRPHAPHSFLNAEAQRRRDAESLARDFITRRGPGRRTAAMDRWSGKPLREQALVPVYRPSGLRSSAERRPRHFFSPFNDCEERWNRRAPGVSAGRKRGDDGRLRPELTCFPAAVGDLMIADSSTGNPRWRPSVLARISLRLCAFASLRSFLWVAGLRVFVSSCLRRGWIGGSAPPRLCVSAFSSSVIPYCGFVVQLPGLICS